MYMCIPLQNLLPIYLLPKASESILIWRFQNHSPIHQFTMEIMAGQQLPVPKIAGHKTAMVPDREYLVTTEFMNQTFGSNYQDFLTPRDHPSHKEMVALW